MQGSAASSPLFCFHCALPLFRSPLWNRGKPFCCLGCSLAYSLLGVEDLGDPAEGRAAKGGAAKGGAGPPAEGRTDAQAARREGASPSFLFLSLSLGIFFAMNVMVFSIALYHPLLQQSHGASPPLLQLMKLLLFVLTTPVMILLGLPLLLWSGKGRPLSMETLILIGTFSAYALSVYSTFHGGHVYFETATMVLILVTLGKWVEASWKRKIAGNLKEIFPSIPQMVKLLLSPAANAPCSEGGGESDTGAVQEAPLSSLKGGDLIVIGPSSVVPVDGEVVEGTGSVDESFLTGESFPQTKGKGSQIFAGTQNLDGTLVVEVRKVGPSTLLASLQARVEAARSRPGLFGRMADRAAALFTPLVLLLSAVGFFLAFQGELDPLSGMEKGILRALAVLLISCPCALGIATPLVILGAVGKGMKNGVLFDSGETIEKLASIKGVALDKTGTLSRGALEVEEVILPGNGPLTREGCLRALASLELHAGSHPVALAILEAAGNRDRPFSPVRVSKVEIYPGLGIKGVVEGVEPLSPTDPFPLLYGNRPLFEQRSFAIPPSLEKIAKEKAREGKMVTFLGWEGEARGIVALQESLREEATEVIAKLRKMGYSLVVLTGDGEASRRGIEKELKVRVKCSLLPDQKEMEVRQFSREAAGSVAMIGDGANDSLAFAGSVGIAIGCKAEVHRAAHVSILHEDLEALPWLLSMARRAGRLIKENLLWAFLYNSTGIALALAGNLSPSFSALLMVLSSAFVLQNSLRIHRHADGHFKNKVVSLRHEHA